MALEESRVESTPPIVRMVIVSFKDGLMTRLFTADRWSFTTDTLCIYSSVNGLLAEFPLNCILGVEAQFGDE